MFIPLKSWKEYGKGMKKFDKGNAVRDKKKTIKFAISDQPGCSSENTENLNKENREGVYWEHMLSLQIRFFFSW